MNNLHHDVFFAYCLLTLCSVKHALAVEVCPTCTLVHDDKALSEFGDALKIIANQELGHQAMQHYLDSGFGLNVQIESINSNERLTKTIDLVTAKYMDRLEILRELSAHVEYMARMKTSSSSTTRHCCNATQRSVEKKADDVEFDAVFKANVDITEMCMQVATEHERANFGVSNDMLYTFKDNLNQFPRAGWQHVHIYGGSSYLYPSVRKKTCEVDDMRRKFWYAKTTMPPIDIVVVIDRSIDMTSATIGNMTLLDLAKLLAKHIINTQNMYSAISIVAFSDSTQSPPSTDDCYATKTAAATVFNMRIFSEFIMSISATGNPSYVAGLRKATAILRNTNSSRPKAAVLITGSMPLDTSHEIRQHMAAMSDIHLLTIGVNIKSNVLHSLLSNMSASARTNGQQSYININSTDSWEADLYPFYQYFSSFLTRHEIFTSAPYYSGLSEDFIWTMSTPVFFRNVLVGVVGVDILFSELLDELNFIKTTTKQYIFIINLLEKSVIYHPNLPLVTSDGYAAIADINDLEKDAARAGIIANIYSGGTGELAIRLSRHIPRWNVHKEGFVNISQTATFYWRKFSSLPVTVCLVVNERHYVVLKSLTLSNVPFGNIQYTEERNLCNHFQKAAIIDDTTLWWSPATFIDPVKRMGIAETLDVLKRYFEIFSGTVNDQIFKDIIMDHVQITRIAHDHWMRRKDSSFTIRRYVALDSGIMRIFPGTWHNRTYDPLTRIWYVSASLFPHRTFISTPQLDDMRGGVIITLSKALIVHNRARRVKAVVGVMGLDFTMMYFRARLEQRFPKCRQHDISCFVIDTSGYVVIHDSFMAAPKHGVPPNTSYVHITTLEPHIAKDLIRLGFMTQIWCQELRTMQRYYMYNIGIRAAVSNIERYPFYEMGHVPKSNIFVLVKKIVQWPTARPPCVCHSRDGSIPRCDDDAECQCPCYRDDTNFRFCENTFTSNWTLCENLVASRLQFLSTPQYTSREKEIAVLRKLPNCFTHDCNQYKTRTDCDLVSYCRWCTTNKDEKNLEKPFCGRHYTCFYGQVGHPSPYGFDVVETKHFYCGPLCSFGIVTATCFCSFPIVVLAMYAKKIRLSKNSTPATKEDYTSVPSITISSDTSPVYMQNALKRQWGSMTPEDKLEYVIPFIQTPSSKSRAHRSHRRDVKHHHHHHRRHNDGKSRHHAALQRQLQQQEQQIQILQPELLSPSRTTKFD